MLTDIIPEIIEEPAKAGCAPGNETIGYLAGEISRLRSELRNIATAKPSEWGEMSDQFQPWAQNRARAALTPPNSVIGTNSEAKDKYGIIDPCAVEDPDGYDGGMTMLRVRTAAQEITETVAPNDGSEPLP